MHAASMGDRNRGIVSTMNNNRKSMADQSRDIHPNARSPHPRRISIKPKLKKRKSLFANVVDDSQFHHWKKKDVKSKPLARLKPAEKKPVQRNQKQQEDAALSSLLQEMDALKQMYNRNGGNSPAVLRSIEALSAQARVLRMQKGSNVPPGPAQNPYNMTPQQLFWQQQQQQQLQQQRRLQQQNMQMYGMGNMGNMGMGMNPNMGNMGMNPYNNMNNPYNTGMTGGALMGMYPGTGMNALQQQVMGIQSIIKQHEQENARLNKELENIHLTNERQRMQQQQQQFQQTLGLFSTKMGLALSGSSGTVIDPNKSGAKGSADNASSELSGPHARIVAQMRMLEKLPKDSEVYSIEASHLKRMYGFFAECLCLCVCLFVSIFFIDSDCWCDAETYVTIWT